ncbi:hypothetical protein B0J18DRAFT_38464 [Chaetomium sp. MPI-SDFR-AT-0129]|nr:hypothetical protein B0J18DRAFT_38464 [Chaetomium sp. MPI-SDFR-AT-0129]
MSTPALITGALLSGAMASLSLIAVPVLLDTTPTPALLLQQWVRMYHYGHRVLPAMAIGTFGLYTYAAISGARGRDRGRSEKRGWALALAAGLTTVAMLPFTWLCMVPTNDELFRLAEQSRKLSQNGPESADIVSLGEVQELVSSWSGLHLVRSGLPFVGVVLGAIAKIWE